MYQDYNDLHSFNENNFMVKTYNIQESDVVLKDFWLYNSFLSSKINYFTIEYTDISITS